MLTGWKPIDPLVALAATSLWSGGWLALATALQPRLAVEQGMPAEVITHLESQGHHDPVHLNGHYAGPG